MFVKVTEYAHHLVRDRVQPGDTVIDATAGNGHDTMFLAKLVGEQGNVYGFDIQRDAIERTAQLLKEHHQDKQVQLIQAGHQEMHRYVTQPASAVMFNLGYLPKGDKTITTVGETTIQAIQSSLDILRPGGIITVAVYWGHEQGKEEKRQVEQFLQQLKQNRFLVLKYEYINQKNFAPFLFAIEKK